MLSDPRDGQHSRSYTKSGAIATIEHNFGGPSTHKFGGHATIIIWFGPVDEVRPDNMDGESNPNNECGK